MPDTVYTASTLSNLSYDDLISWINVAGENPQLDAYIQEAAKYGVSEMQAVEDLAGTYMNFYKNEAGQYTITSFNNTAQMTNVSPIDSNISTVVRSNVQTPLNRAVDAIRNKINITKYPASGSFAQRAGYVLGSVGSAYAAVSTGITLGKIISSHLYDVAPNFWDAIGVSESSFDPATWSSITNGDDSWQAGLFNFILGIDPDTGNSQMYMDENAFAYMAGIMAQQGVFNPLDTVATVDDAVAQDMNLSAYFTLPVPYLDVSSSVTLNAVLNPLTTSARYYVEYYRHTITNLDSNNVKIAVVVNDSQAFSYILVASDTNNCRVQSSYIRKRHSLAVETHEETVTLGAYSYTYNDKTVYYSYVWFVDTRQAAQTYTISELNYVDRVPSMNFQNNDLRNRLAWILVYGNYSSSGGIDGIDNQQNATLPTNTDTWTTPQATLDSLKQQYPDLWDNALTYDNVQPDGTNPQKVYIPVATPTATSALDDAPLGGDATQTQANTQIQPSIDPQTLLKLITSVVTQPNPQVQTATDTETQPIVPNPVDTGSGTTPIPAIPDGIASALWSVYHPTQQQVNDFGAWLWTDNIITQFVQAMNNPMDGIITLHKIFAQPVDSGNGTIVIGRLDSQVPTALVTQQYVSVDCGSVSVQEYFGNVFDYVGTQISIYLPFIGIQPLNVDDVMRSTLNVVYKVDLFTGACLATIHVNRDGYNPMMYQFTGVCSVEYPLTGGQHSSIINGFFGLMGAGVAAAAGPTGIIAAGATAIGVASSVNQMARTQNARSGAFGANAGAMGIKKPYLIISRPQTKVARQDTHYTGYSTNYTDKVSAFTGMVKARQVHVEGVNATDTELEQIESLLKEGILV